MGDAVAYVSRRAVQHHLDIPFQEPLAPHGVPIYRGVIYLAEASAFTVHHEERPRGVTVRRMARVDEFTQEISLYGDAVSGSVN